MNGREQGEILIFIYPKDSPVPPDARVARAARAYTGRANGDFSIARPARGKPFFPHTPDVHFSITHSGAYWLCAVSSAPVGLDLQRAQRVRAAALSRRFFHPDEDAFLRAEGFRSFFAVWAAKESYVKYTGAGIDERFSAFAAADARGLRAQIGAASLRHIPFAEGYSLCLCAQNTEAVTLVEEDGTRREA